MVQCLVDYVRDELYLLPAPGVSARYGGADPQDRYGFNHPTGAWDDTIEIFEQAFTNAQRSEDVLGVVYEEIWHSRQEHYVETHPEWHMGYGGNVWDAPAPCGESSDICQTIEDSYDGPLVYLVKYGPALEIQAKNAVLELEIAFSQSYINHLKAHQGAHTRFIEFAPGFFTDPEAVMEIWAYP
jgi:hypothetical protein